MFVTKKIKHFRSNFVCRIPPVPHQHPLRQPNHPATPPHPESFKAPDGVKGGGSGGMPPRRPSRSSPPASRSTTTAVQGTGAFGGPPLHVHFRGGCRPVDIPLAAERKCTDPPFGSHPNLYDYPSLPVPGVADRWGWLKGGLRDEKILKGLLIDEGTHS